jgi:transglutaminase-like putative cysteine protease
MRLRIEHETRLSYDEPAFEGHTEVRLQPLQAGGQRRLSFALTLEPPARVQMHRDRHGNAVHHFDLLMPYDRLRVAAVTEVETVESFEDREGEPSLLDRFEFCSATAYAPFTSEVRALARDCLETGRAGASVMNVVARVRERLRYEPGATDVTTSAAEALARGRGVCQDFAHLTLAACRCLGLAARYVSGYVYAPEHAAGAAASHAWVDVWLPSRGWVALDPTHDGPQTERHVRVAVGRDYADVPPTRGVFRGNGKERLDVRVAIQPF